MIKFSKKFIAVLVACVVFSTMCAMSVSSAENQTTVKEWVNIYDAENPQLLYSYDGHSTVENGDLTLHIWQDVPYEVGIQLPEALTENYKITGTIKVNDVIATADDDISIWNCLRIVAGRTSQIDYNTISIYRKVGVQIVNFNQGAAVGVGNIIPLPEGIEFKKDATMQFELERQGKRLIFSLDGTKLIDYILADGEDYASADNHSIIGFQSMNADYTVSDLQVLIEKTVGLPPATEKPTVTETPTETPTATATEEPTAPPTTIPTETSTPDVGENPGTGDDAFTFYGYMAIAVCALTFVMYLTRKEKKNGRNI